MAWKKFGYCVVLMSDEGVADSATWGRGAELWRMTSATARAVWLSVGPRIPRVKTGNMKARRYEYDISVRRWGGINERYVL